MTAKKLLKLLRLYILKCVTINGKYNCYCYSVDSKTQPINLRTLQGAFIVLAIGYTVAGNVHTA